MSQQQPVFKEEKIKSPITDGDSCYRVYTEPLTEDYYLCLGSGFMTTSYYKDKSEALEKTMKQNPKLIQSLQFIDEETSLVWFPVVLNMGDMGIIYPEGTPDDWYWRYATVIDIPKEKQQDYPIPGKPGEYYINKLDVDKAKTYSKENFLAACYDMGIIKDSDGESITHIFGQG